MDPQSTTRTAKSTYDGIAPHYDVAVRPLERWFLKKLRAATLHQLPADSHVLELGAGTGLNFGFYPPRARGVATEPSYEMLKLARGKERPGQVLLVQSCAEALPFQNASFDAAFGTLVFCSVISPGQAFAELRRVVKPGGMVVLLEHVRPKGVLGPVFDLLNLITEPLSGDHFNRHTAAEAQASGLQLKRVQSRFLGIINLITCEV